MLEFEVKARVADAGALGRTLGEPLRVERHRDTYFGHPCRDFAVSDEALRLREVDGRVELTYKGPRLDAASKARVERSVGVAGFDAAAGVLEGLGFVAVAEVRKSRAVFQVEGFEVALDDVEGLGVFLELERALPEGADVTLTREAAFRLLDDWGLRERVRESYLELLFASGASSSRRAR